MKQRIPFILVAIVIAVVIFLWWRSRGANANVTASGTVEATEAQLGFQASGRIETVRAHEGDAARAGEVLAQLDTVETAARRAQAIAQAVAARATLLDLERGARPQEIAQAKSALDAAEQRRADAARDLDRARQLFGDEVLSQEALDKAQTAFEIAAAQRDQASEQYDLVRAGARAEQIAAQRAVLAQTEAAVRTLDATLANMTIRAPFDGVITVRAREPGEIVQAGSGVVTLMDPNDRWVRIYIPENRIGAVALGDSAEIRSDTDPGHAYGGRVIFIASEAEFTPKAVQTREERVRLVFAVKVRITSDRSGDLKPGMSADVHLFPRP